jgi:type IV secretion system protein VirB5
MSLFSKNGKSSKPGSKKREGSGYSLDDEKMRQEIVENNPWMSSKKRHIDVYQELAFSVAQWRLATFVMLVMISLSVLCIFSLATSVTIQPYVIQTDQHGYAIPVKKIDASNIDARVISAQIGTFIINSRARVRDAATQLLYAENSYNAIAGESNAELELRNYYRESPPTRARYPVSVKILSVRPVSGASYQASWTEKILAGEGLDQEFGYIGTFSVLVSPPGDYSRLIKNPLGIYINDFNIIRSY